VGCPPLAAVLLGRQWFRWRRVGRDDEALGGVATTAWLLGSRVERRLVAAPTWPRFGPFGPHLGLGRLDMCMSKPSQAVGGAARARGGRDGGALTAARR
jgi:hypothetical protein